MQEMAFHTHLSSCMPINNALVFLHNTPRVLVQLTVCMFYTCDIKTFPIIFSCLFLIVYKVKMTKQLNYWNKSCFSNK